VKGKLVFVVEKRIAPAAQHMRKWGAVQVA